MNYTVLTPEAQQAMLEQRLAQYEAEHYQHAINVLILGVVDAADEGAKEAIKSSKAAMSVLDKAHASVVKEIALRSPKSK